MAKVLCIKANPKPENESFSLKIADAFLAAYKQEQPNDEIIELDLYHADIPEIDIDVFSGWGKLQQGSAFDQLSAEEKHKVQRINELTDQFVAADKYVIVTPMWNLSVPPRMKTYIDTICMAGKTFRYTEEGPIGLMTGKKAVHIQARGGVYSEGPGASLEFGDSYIKAIMNFLGVTDYSSVIAEGMAQTPDLADSILNEAIEQAKEAAPAFAGQKVSS